MFKLNTSGKKVYRVVAVLLSVCLLLTGCSSVKTNNAGNTGYNPKSIDTSGMKTVELSDDLQKGLDTAGYLEAASNDSFSFYYHPKDGSIIIKNKKDGFIWSSAVDIPKHLSPELSLNPIWRSNMNTLFNISYYEKGANKGEPSETTPYDSGTKFQVTAIKNGISVLFSFELIGITVRLDMTLAGDTFKVRIPQDGISENGKYRLVSVKLLPFFGAQSSNGYALLPDGCGALAYFNKEGSNGVITDWSIYGEDQPDLDRIKENNELGIKNAYVPVFGIKSGSNGFLAALTAGETDAKIEYVQSGYGVDMFRVFPVFTYRRRVDLTEVSGAINGNTAAGTDDEKTKVYRYETDFSEKDAEVTYFLLSGNNADYSGMANRYRDYLTEEGTLRKRTEQTEQLPVVVDIFCGVTKEKVLGEEYISTTSYKQAAEISDILHKNGIGNIFTTLWGWQKRGYGEYPPKSDAESRLGGMNGLKDYITRAAKNGNKISLQVDPVTLQSKTSGFSTKSDVVYTLSNIPASNKKNTLFLRKINSVFDKFLPSFKTLAAELGTGLTIEEVGQLLYYDNSKNGVNTRLSAKDVIRRNLALIKKQGTNITTDGNGYVLSSASRITNLDYKGSGFDVTNEIVPFYQMVLHGSLLYSAIPMNFESDPTQTELKWAEYGYIPCFMLTYDKAKDLKNTPANWIYTSSVEEWGQTIADVYDRMSASLTQVADARIIRHEKLEDDVYMTTYDNGYRVLVNYSKTDKTIDGMNVSARGFSCIRSK